MPRKLFLSFLGTNNYVECNYYDETAPSNRVDGVKYVQEALIQMYCKDFGGDDRFCFFLTDMARRMNWEDDGQWNKNTQGYDLPNVGLFSRLKQLGVEEQITDVCIPEGFSSEEIWEIFEIVFGCIEDGDEVYFDITHAFRSLPLLGMALLNYAKALRKIQVNAIFYGAFEKLGPAPEVAKMPMEARNAPVLDLLSVSELQDWTNAAYEFVHYGKVSNLRQLTRKRISPVLAETEGADEIASRLRIISNTTEEMAKAIVTNRGAKIYQSIDFDNLNDNLQFFEDHQSFIKPLNAIIKILANKVAPFRNNDPLHWLKSAKWCAAHGMYQQGITQLQEGILTWLCLHFEPQDSFFHWGNKEARDLISAAFNVVGKDESEWHGKAKVYADRCKKLVEDEMILSFKDLYISLTGLRNDINHGGYTGTTRAKTFETGLKDFINQAEAIVTGQSSEGPIQQGNFLLNLSNHPLSSWQEAQRVEAERLFGKVEDMAFPAIPPEMSEEELDQLVDEYFQKIIKESPAAVHLMGEMTFTCRLVQRLKAAGIPCLASTTERIAREEEGRKVTEFRFSRFRFY